MKLLELMENMSYKLECEFQSNVNDCIISELIVIICALKKQTTSVKYDVLWNNNNDETTIYHTMEAWETSIKPLKSYWESNSFCSSSVA